jgi:hypothetical protein
MAGNPTGVMGVPDYLGWDWTSKSGIPIVCVPGCPTHPDNPSETILYLLYQVAGQAPMIPLDEQLRPQWLFNTTVHEGCDRAGYYEQGEFAEQNVEPVQQHRVDTEEVRGENAVCLGAQEFSPARPVAARCRVDAGSFQDQPHRAGRKLVAQASKFAVDPAVSPG